MDDRQEFIAETLELMLETDPPDPAWLSADNTVDQAELKVLKEMANLVDEFYDMAQSITVDDKPILDLWKHENRFGDELSLLREIIAYLCRLDSWNAANAKLLLKQHAFKQRLNAGLS